MIDWENQYEATGKPDMKAAIEEHIDCVDDKLGYEWDLEEDVAYIEGDFNIVDIETIDIVEPKFIALPFCEHCGENHTDFGCEFREGGTSWCLNCYLSNKPDANYLYNYYSKLKKEAHIKYLESKIRELKE